MFKISSRTGVISPPKNLVALPLYIYIYIYVCVCVCVCVCKERERVREREREILLHLCVWVQDAIINTHTHTYTHTPVHTHTHTHIQSIHTGKMWHKDNFKRSLVEKRIFPSPRPVAVGRLLNPIYLTISPFLEGK